jgi:hypothetical protein
MASVGYIPNTVERNADRLPSITPGLSDGGEVPQSWENKHAKNLLDIEL